MQCVEALRHRVTPQTFAGDLEEGAVEFLLV
jgi:hypothetical protein